MRNSFESGMLESVDIDRIHERTKTLLDKGRVQEESFIDPYGKETVGADLERVRTLEVEFEKKSTPEQEALKKVADIFEALVLWHGEQSEWLGSNAVTIQTSKFDDYVNGVDMVIEFQGDEPRTASYVGLATDVTFTADTTAKFDRLRGQIERGELARVKYFHSEHMNVHGQLSKLPEVIVGAEKKMVLELAELWAEKKYKELAQHRVQIMILIQIREQLITFAEYAKSLKQPESDEIASIYLSRLAIIEKILADKADIVAKVKYEINDMVHSSIIEFMTRWRKNLLEKK